jgi:hypothetical protein
MTEQGPFEYVLYSSLFMWYAHPVGHSPKT